MDKTVLQDYIDACELVKETELAIRRLRQKKRTVVQTSVKGSSPEFPYAPQHFKVRGSAFTVRDDNRLRREEDLLLQRKAAAERISLQVEEWLQTIPARMQRIVRYRYFEGLTWDQVAAKMGRKATADSVRMECERFFEKK